VTALLIILTVVALVDARTARTVMATPVPEAALLHYRRARTIAWAIGVTVAWAIYIFGSMT